MMLYLEALAVIVGLTGALLVLAAGVALAFVAVEELWRGGQE